MKYRALSQASQKYKGRSFIKYKGPTFIIRVGQGVASRGFVALVSVIVIASMLTVLMVSVGAAAFFARFNALDGEHKQQGRYLAQGGGHGALLRVIQQGTYQPMLGGECVSIDDTCDETNSGRECKICEVTFNDGVVRIQTRASVYGTYTNILASVSTSTGSAIITELSEQPVYIGPSCPLP